MKSNLPKTLVLLFSIFCFYHSSFAQNLIDGTFEERILATSKNAGHINTLDSTQKLKYWKSPNQADLSLVKGDSENYLHVDIRKAVWEDKKRTFHHEYAQVYFFEELEKDAIYKFSFEMKSSPIATAAHMDIQVFFGNKDIPKRISTSTPLPAKFQLKSDNLVTPALQFNYKETWQHIEKYYKAKGGERYLIFGIFDNAQIQWTQLLGKNIGSPVNPINSSLLFRNLSFTKAPISKPAHIDPTHPKDVKSLDLEFENIYFEIGSAILTLDAKAILDKLADYLHRNPTFKLEITGYTDAIGNTDLNLVLSQKRADNAFYYLEKIGLNKDRVLRNGKGELKSLKSNEEQAGNRRVNFNIIKN